MSSIPNLDVVDNDQSFNDLLAFEFDFEMDQHPPPPFSAIEPVVINANAGLRQENYRPTVKSSIIAKYQRRRARRNNQTNRGLLDGDYKAPNMSRRIQSAKLCAFPTFDKCDSLLFVPVSMVKYMNSEDFPAMRQLLAAHVDRRCTVDFKGIPTTMGAFVNLQEIIGQMHPDKISCVHDTKVIGNTIHASLFTKFTDNNLVYNAITSMHRKDFPVFFPKEQRASRWDKKIPQDVFDRTSRAELLQLLESEQDVVVYANMDWIFTFDYNTRKITHMQYIWTFVSIRDSRDSNLGGLGTGSL